MYFTPVKVSRDCLLVTAWQVLVVPSNRKFILRGKILSNRKELRSWFAFNRFRRLLLVKVFWPIFGFWVKLAGANQVYSVILVPSSLWTQVLVVYKVLGPRPHCKAPTSALFWSNESESLLWRLKLPLYFSKLLATIRAFCLFLTN